MAAEGPGLGKNATVPGRDNADETVGMSLVDFCVQLDDCTPTVRMFSSWSCS